MAAQLNIPEIREFAVDSYHTNKRFFQALLVVFFLYLMYAAVSDVISGALSKRLKVSSPVGGSYAQVLQVIDDYAAENSVGLGFKLDLELLKSGGSVETIEQIAKGDIHLGLAQGNTEFDLTRAPPVLELYSEIYLFLTTGPYADLGELLRSFSGHGKTLRVASIGKGSQVYLDVMHFIDLYGISCDSIEHIPANYETTRDLLRDGGVDLALIVGGFGHEVVRDIMRLEGVRLLSINPELFNLGMPNLHPYEVPVGFFGVNPPRPAKPIQTFTTPATLVASSRLRESTVVDLMHFLVSRREELRKRLAHLDIRMVKEDLQDTLHPAAQTYAQQKSGASWLQTYLPVLEFLGEIVAAVLTGWGLWQSISRGGREGAHADAEAAGQPEVALPE